MILVLSLLFDRNANPNLLRSMLSMPTGFNSAEGKYCCLLIVFSNTDVFVNCLNYVSLMDKSKSRFGLNHERIT